MESILRGIQRMTLMLKNGTKALSGTIRHSSLATKCKIIEGNNGERIFPSPHGDIDIPSLTVPEFVWKNIDQWANRIAVECGVTGRKYTYAEARDNSNYVARSLINMGLKDGDVVALILPNLPESPISFLGILEAGLVATAVNPIYTIDEISRQLRLSGAKAIITSTSATNALIAGKTTLPQNAPIIVVSDASETLPEGTISFRDLLTRGKTLPRVPERIRRPDDLCILPYSSGTTGLPKGVMLTHENLIANMVMSNNSTDLIGPGFQDVVPVVLPLFHIYGMNIVMLPRLVEGAKLITLPNFTAESYIDVLQKHRCTLLYCVPSIVLFLGASPMVNKEHFETIRGIFSGAAPLTATDVERIHNKLNMNSITLPFLQGYGLTECSGIGFIQERNEKYSSIGYPITKSEARLVDPMTGQDILTPGQTGEIWIRGPHIMKGYFNNEEATNEILHNDWLKTGDIAYFDDDFSFLITDRLKELIKVKGYQVPPAELEGILRTHPDIADAAVVGVPDARDGEVPKAFVVLKKNHMTTEKNIQNFVTGKVSEFKELKGGVTFIDEIPRNASGKILRISLKNLDCSQ